MAQDFYRHFGKEEIGVIICDTMIDPTDFDGVSHMPIKALEERKRQLQHENDELSTQINMPMTRIEELTQEKLNILTKQVLSSSK